MNEFDIRDGVLYKYLGAHGTVVIPDTVQAIHEKAFRGNTTVTRIEIPNTVVTIEWGAFSFCENLEQLIIPPSVYFISVSAIEGCTKLQSIIIEGSKYYYAEDNRIFSTMDANKVISTDILKYVNSVLWQERTTFGTVETVLRPILQGRMEQDYIVEDADDIAVDNAVYPYTIRKSTVVFGGHETWVKALKPLLKGDIKFIAREMKIDVSLVRYADVIWIQSNAIFSVKKFEKGRYACDLDSVECYPAQVILQHRQHLSEARQADTLLHECKCGKVCGADLGE